MMANEIPGFPDIPILGTLDIDRNKFTPAPGSPDFSLKAGEVVPTTTRTAIADPLGLITGSPIVGRIEQLTERRTPGPPDERFHPMAEELSVYPNSVVPTCSCCGKSRSTILFRKLGLCQGCLDDLTRVAQVPRDGR